MTLSYALQNMGDLKQLCPQEVCLASVQHASHAFTVSSASEASFFTFAFTRRSAVQQKTFAYICMQNMKGSPLRSLSFVGKGTPLQRCAVPACLPGAPEPANLHLLRLRSLRRAWTGQIWTAEVEKKDIERLLSKASLAFTGCFVRYATERTRQRKHVKKMCVCVCAAPWLTAQVL